MTLLNHLQFQEIDSDEIPDTHQAEEGILLNESIDEGSLENFWNEVDEDIHKDPEWFDFAD